MPGQRGPAAAGEQPEPVATAGAAISAHRQHPQPGRRQLDRQRQAVEAADDLDHGADVSRRRGRSRAHGRGPVERTAAPPGTAGASAGVRVRRAAAAAAASGAQRLAGDAERLPAGREDADARAVGAACRSTSRATGVDQVLAVVEHEQAGRLPQPVEQAIPGVLGRAARRARSTRASRQAERAEQRSPPDRPGR